MELLGKLSLWIHIAAGVSTLIAGPFALYYQSHSSRHRIAGRIFFTGMSIVVITSILGFLKYPDQVFFQFLLALSFLVGYNILRGVRAIQFMKGGTPKNFDKILAWTILLAGVAMLNMAVWYLGQARSLALPILFTAFGLATITDSWNHIRLMGVQDLDKRWWFHLHVRSMFGAFIASTTAFTVNAVDFLPWYIQWFGPTILLTPLQIYLLGLRKLTKSYLGSPFEKKVAQPQEAFEQG